MSNSHEDTKPDGAAFDDFFESLGKKAEHLTVNDDKQESPAATIGAVSKEALDENDQKVVDEIESLCMNCRENVRIFVVALRSCSLCAR